ncbi:17197_t:CDS:2, partial [Cetraspora pellucida]
NYPIIEVTCHIGNCNYNYQYDVLKLGNYPTKNIKQTQREKYQILNNYKNYHLKKLVLDFHSCFENLFKKYNFSNTKLNNFELDISGKPIEFKFTKSNPSLNYLDSTIYAYNKGLISKDSYRNLAAIQPLLEREYIIAI